MADRRAALGARLRRRMMTSADTARRFLELVAARPPLVVRAPNADRRRFWRAALPMLAGNLHTAALLARRGFKARR